MLLSMTGHGEAHQHADGLSIAVEIRTVNNRYFKLNLRVTEGYLALEPHVEAAVRQQIRRGTVQLNLQIGREPTADDYRINEAVLTRLRAAARAAFGVALGHSERRLAAAVGAAGRRRGAGGRAWTQSRRSGRSVERVLNEALRGWPRCGSTKAARWPPTWPPTPARSPPSWPTSRPAPRRSSPPIARG